MAKTKNKSAAAATEADVTPTSAAELQLSDDEMSALISSVELRAARPDVSLREQHEDWRYQMVSRGWRRGAERDAVNRLHPCLVAFDDLTPEAREEQAARFGFSFEGAAAPAEE
jgi:hypothetical protein